MLSHLACALVALTMPLWAVSEFAVTYDFSGGRFGDCLLSYLHAKWLAYEKNIPLIYRPFLYSSNLVMDEKEKTFKDLGMEPRVRVYWGQPINPGIRMPVFYICPYFPESLWEQRETWRPDGSPWAYFRVDWKDPQFRKMVCEMVAPKKELTLTLPPLDKISIALHIREGGDYDQGNGKYAERPLKFPPFEYYIECLEKVLALCPNRPLHCQLFTDALDPGALIQRLQAALPPDVPITYGYRKNHNAPSKNVLEDFFSFFHYDILIRGQSNYSLIPSLLHDFAAVYAPQKFIEVGGKITITEIETTIEPEPLRKILE